jgi:hypothetical protein
MKCYYHLGVHSIGTFISYSTLYNYNHDEIDYCCGVTRCVKDFILLKRRDQGHCDNRVGIRNVSPPLPPRIASCQLTVTLTDAY